MLNGKIKIVLILSSVFFSPASFSQAQEDSVAFSPTDFASNVEDELVSAKLFSSCRAYGWEDTTDHKKLWLVGGIHAAGYTGSFIALYNVWYDDFKTTKLHAFDDWPEWNQMDKAGHMWTSYHITRYSSEMFQWAGVKNKKAVLLGSSFSLLYTTTLEFFDGYSEGWGFSFSDIGANIIGTAFYAVQELRWNRQYILRKFSYHESPYAAYRPSLLGNNFSESILKDYNGQTYWHSLSPGWLIPHSKFPKWLCLSFGYGADGMTGGRENPSLNEAGESIPSFNRVREYYLSVDIDFESIHTNSKFLKTFFKIINCIKVPAPAFILNSKGVFKAHPFYF